MKWRKNTRLRDYNYKTDGYYFITICTDLKKPLLAQHRKEAETILQSLPSRFVGIKLDFYYFMPDHLHAIFILSNADVSISEIVRTYKALVTKTTGCKPFWERNYYEHIIRNERALYEIRKYIQENPEKDRLDFKAINRRTNATTTNKGSRVSDKSDHYKQGRL